LRMLLYIDKMSILPSLRGTKQSRTLQGETANLLSTSGIASYLAMTGGLFSAKQLCKSLFSLAIILSLLNFSTSAQQTNHLPYVNPFIGTAQSNVLTKWGSEGGTYPGAVAPSGSIQLSPETRFGKGYNYGDSTICYFSCFRHMSGFPQGSAGGFYVMPVNA